jgi:CRP/FNR family cyclic AMP-dependent transcriptional regulator
MLVGIAAAAFARFRGVRSVSPTVAAADAVRQPAREACTAACPREALNNRFRSKRVPRSADRALWQLPQRAPVPGGMITTNQTPSSEVVMQTALMHRDSGLKHCDRAAVMERADAEVLGLPNVVAQSFAMSPVLKAIAPERRAQLEKRCNWRHYERGECIVDYLDASDDVFIIAAGQVRVSIYSASGIAVAFSDLGAGDIFGEFAAIDGAPRSAGIEAQSRCLVASISSGVFREMLESEPAAMLALLRKVIMTARQMTARVYEFSVLPVSDRVHAELLRMAKTTPTQGKSIAISPAPTNAEIASRISTHREAVSREIKNLSRIGIVERRDGILWIKDVEWLASMVHEETGE